MDGEISIYSMGFTLDDLQSYGKWDDESGLLETSTFDINFVQKIPDSLFFCHDDETE